MFLFLFVAFDIQNNMHAWPANSLHSIEYSVHGLKAQKSRMEDGMSVIR